MDAETFYERLKAIDMSLTIMEWKELLELFEDVQFGITECCDIGVKAQPQDSADNQIKRHTCSLCGREHESVKLLCEECR